MIKEDYNNIDENSWFNCMDCTACDDTNGVNEELCKGLREDLNTVMSEDEDGDPGCGCLKLKG